MINPYNYTKPGNLFCGYSKMRKEILNGFYNQHSFALIGGRRCGKTSMLMQIEKDIRKNDNQTYNIAPVFLDITAMGQINPDFLFKKIYCLITKDTNAPDYGKIDAGQEYECFKNSLRMALPAITLKYGETWLIVLLIDELDAAYEKLENDSFFMNIRSFLSNSEFNNRFCLVASGVDVMDKLISSGASPLNILRNKYLSILSEKAAIELIEKGFEKNFYDNAVIEHLFEISGRHPYILHAILEKLYDKEKWDKEKINKAAGRFLKERNDFRRWNDTFKPPAHAVYRIIADAPDGKTTYNKLKEKIATDLKHEIQDSLRVLSYHGVIDDTVEDEPKLAGTLFKDWYFDNNINYSAAQALERLRQEIEKQDMNKSEKEKALAVLDPVTDKNDKTCVKNSVEKAVALIKKNGEAAGAFNSIIKAGENLGKVLGIAAGWLI